jgi:hypothetical protein
MLSVDAAVLVRGFGSLITIYSQHTREEGKVGHSPTSILVYRLTCLI